MRLPKLVQRKIHSSFTVSGMTTSSNPWLVPSVHDFWFLRCPECPFETKEVGFFEEHAIENHPLSLELFVKAVKEENNQDYTESYDFRQGSTETLFVSSIPPEVHIKEENISDDEHEHKESEAVPEDEDNAKQNLLEDTRESYEPQFDEFNDFTETVVEENEKMTKKGKAEKQKNSDHSCTFCKAVFSAPNDVKLHIASSHSSTKKSSAKQSNNAIAKMAKKSSFKKQTAKKSKKIAVPCVSAPMVVTQSQVPTAQQTGKVTLPRGQQVRHQTNAHC